MTRIIIITYVKPKITKCYGKRLFGPWGRVEVSTVLANINIKKTMAQIYFKYFAINSCGLHGIPKN